jgi:steroid delta-isomerase-like uncharacterized protein
MASSVETHRSAHDAFNRRDWNRMRELSSDDIEYVDHPRGLTLHGFEEFLGWLREWADGMSDATVGNVEYLEARDHSVARFTGTGTNDGPLGPAQATGRRMEMAFCEIFRVEDGKLSGGEIFYDSMTLLTQLGVVEAPAAA